MSSDLFGANHPAHFWRLVPEQPISGLWESAAFDAARSLPEAARGLGVLQLLERTLGEGQFGVDHWRLAGWLRLYYRVKGRLPRGLIRLLRRAYQSTRHRPGGLHWPVEDRYRRFLWDTLAEVLRRSGREETSFVFFWPGGHTHALVLTHDIETRLGQSWVSRVADLEEKYGFRLSFNFVAEGYPLDEGLVSHLVWRGFEVGVHGLRHDGREFSSRREFERRAETANGHLERSGASGFRAPLTHRQPEWMQYMSVEYDGSFFDTDPYETIPGGTMSLWPFVVGHFIELPYTLPQDHTLTELMGERAPALWLLKMAYLARWFGMALVNSHPDYLREPARWRVYESFLDAIRSREGAWNALPRQVARWWRLRATTPALELLGRYGGALAVARLVDDRLDVIPPPRRAVDALPP